MISPYIPSMFTSWSGAYRCVRLVQPYPSGVPERCSLRLYNQSADVTEQGAGEGGGALVEKVQTICSDAISIKKVIRNVRKKYEWKCAWKNRSSVAHVDVAHVSELLWGRWHAVTQEAGWVGGFPLFIMSDPQTPFIEWAPATDVKAERDTTEDRFNCSLKF